ncbi:MAG: hypothetical protein HC866_17335 [Leptolyngbyaceae cyanobacterium RU_5_1]|nr:hypothetical protein [Leptolyngbyaceae cyanobacterium RU_5_1]
MLIQMGWQVHQQLLPFNQSGLYRFRRTTHQDLDTEVSRRFESTFSDRFSLVKLLQDLRK